MKFDMHCHTKEGSLDGKITIEETIRLLKAKGYDGMLVSDHNSYRGYRYYKKHVKNKLDFDFVVLRGIEYDTIDCGHILVILPTGVHIPLFEIRGLPVALLIEIVHYFGGILGPAHPYGERFLSIKNTRIGKKRDEIYRRFDFFETFNSCESKESNEKASMLALEYRRPQFGGSDSHKDTCVGLGYTSFPVPITCETDLIEAVNNRERITSGGSYYNQTTKDHLGPFNKILVFGFWFYNKLCAGYRFPKRHQALIDHLSDTEYMPLKYRRYIPLPKNDAPNHERT